MPKLILEYEDQNDIIESYRLLYTHIASGLLSGGRGSLILLTSSASGEGKTFIASNLSLVMARSGKKVLLIDCSIARPAVQKIFPIGKNAPGLTDILVKGAPAESVVMNVTDILLGGMPMDQAVKFKGLDRLNIISAGTPLSVGGELLRSNKLDMLLEELKGKYDCVILDGPSVSASADSLILASKCDMTYIVYAAGRTPRWSVRSAIQHLSASIGAANKAQALKGVIMNRCI